MLVTPGRRSKDQTDIQHQSIAFWDDKYSTYRAYLTNRSRARDLACIVEKNSNAGLCNIAYCISMNYDQSHLTIKYEACSAYIDVQEH